MSQLRQELQGVGADPAILNIGDWSFPGATELLPASYETTVNGTIELSDKSKPASETHFQSIEIFLHPPPP